MKRILVFILTIVTVIISLPHNALAEAPDIQAPSAILMEASTGKIIYEKNADDVLAPASITNHGITEFVIILMCC